MNKEHFYSVVTLFSSLLYNLHYSTPSPFWLNLFIKASYFFDNIVNWPSFLIFLSVSLSLLYKLNVQLEGGGEREVLSDKPFDTVV